MKLHKFIKPAMLILTVMQSLNLFAQYAGGDAGGFAVTTSYQSVCEPITYPDMYKGGTEDGFHAVAVVQANCSPLVLPAIYAGGTDDGHAMAGLNLSNCSPVVYPNIFTGGSEDGYAMTGITQAGCNPPVYPNIFTGGTEDGFAAVTLNQANCSPAPLPNIYVGGNDDGHAMIAMFTACAPFADFVANPLAVCQDDTVHFTDMSLGTPTSWAWTFNGGNPANSSLQNPVVVYNAPGVYSVTLFITSLTGNSTITKTDYITVNAVPTPAISASGPITFCESDSVLLTCNPAYSAYLWSNGATTQSIQSIISDTYVVTVTAANGCQGVSNPINVSVLSNPKPVIFATGPSPLCIGDSMVLTSSPAASYLWSPGSQNTQSIKVTSSGTFWVSASYASGCSRMSDPVNVSFGNTPAKPVITPSGPLTFCAGGSVTLLSSPAPGYLWSPESQTSQSILVSNNGTFYVEAVGASGCINVSDPVTVIVLPQTPVPNITAGGPTTFCAGGSVLLTSDAATSYLWSPGGEITQSITATTSGTYSVIAGNGTSCTAASLPVTVTVNAQTPVAAITPGGPTTFCSGGNVVLISDIAASYLWSPGGEITQSITATTSGTYAVITDNGTGCTASSLPVTVTVNTQTPVPTITPGGLTTFCSGGSVVLTSDAATSYLWSPGGEITQSITATASGTYSVIADNGTGCTAESLPVIVTVKPQTPIPAITPAGPTTFCSGGSVLLSSVVASSYLWSPGGEITQSITANASGTYSVITDNGTGCTAESLPVTVTVNTQTPVPTITPGGPTTFCSGGSVMLTSGAANSYLWSPGGESTQSITTTTSGTYSVITDNGTGCTAESLPVTVTVNTQTPVPTITPGGPTTFCSGGSVVLTSDAAGSYLWAPGGEITQSITATTSGSYSVITNNGTGCTAASLPISVTVLTVPANPVIQVSGPLNFCEGDSVILTSDPALSYHWYPSGETTQSISVSTSGTHYVEISNGNCISVSTPVSINVLASPPVQTITVNGSAGICNGDSVMLTASPAATYLWSPGGETTQSLWVSASGTFWVEGFNASGCSAVSAGTTITLYPNPVADIIGDTVGCEGTTENYTVSNVPGTDYFWSVNGAQITGGTGTSSIEVLFNDEGNVQIQVQVVSQTTGCSATDVMNVSSLPAPVAYAGPDLNICYGDTTQLYASGGTTYHWITVAGLSNPEVSDPMAFPLINTQYIVEVANGSCVDRDTVLIIVNPLPVADAGSDAFINMGEFDTLTGTGGQYYLWTPSTGLNNAEIASPVAGPDETTTYVLTVTDVNGCSAVDEVTVYVTQLNDVINFPNTFTPNGDGFNETWIIEGLEAYPEHKLIVFNRWGNKVFDAQPYLNDWNGDCIGKPLPDGTYYFVLDLGDGSEIIKSYLTIFR